MTSVKFYSLKEDNFVFSNFYFSTIEIEKVVYPTVEHYYQSQKFFDEEYRKFIIACNTPAKVFYLARQKIRGGYYDNYCISKEDKTKLNDVIKKYRDSVHIRDDWNSIKDHVMRKGIYAKFTQSPLLKEKLLNTEDKTIIEDSPRDWYWGVGKDGTGKNMLGIILMEVRSILAGVFELPPTMESNWVVPGFVLASAYPSSRSKRQRNNTITNLMEEEMNVWISLMEENKEKNMYSYRKIIDPECDEPKGNFSITAYSKKYNTKLIFERYSIPDRKITSDDEVLSIVNRIIEYVCDKKKVLVHCLGGKGRTGTVLGILLGKLYGMPFEDILDTLETSFRTTRRYEGKHCKRMPQTQVQFKQIKRVLS